MGKEFGKEWKEMQNDGGQLFTYAQQEPAIEFLCLYASDFDEDALQIIDEQQIISHKDNKDILLDDPTLKSFKDAQNLKNRFKVWKETYQLESTQKGIFEENIQAYQIGKDKYTLDIDTKIIDATDKKGKYHQFRTILRKYNVSRRENAFEVLVNLFLCKIVDEKENPQHLKFYWKGIAYDNYYDLVDRLQELYKIGMDKFLHQEIVYISNKEIDDAFWAIKQTRNATKDHIKKIFRDLKFFKGLDFEFIKVHNKANFNKNAKILLEIIQMWQGLRLKTKEQNQFLGDMFEFFLDNGIKQSEGQFFTPVPICKFIVMSLPLESQVQSKNETLKVIDYACGSGHFLTEYALQIKPLVRKYKQVEPSEYYKNIYGIEKEDRLAKVAKVSAFMYGLDEIQIIDADALASQSEIKEESFDILVANPPFAVEDFLMTLEESDREKYELLNTVSDLGNKNIQCFFLERAKQLMTGGGVIGIIVPSSVLSNSDTMHVQTREMLLKFFDFVAIAELGSGTFGKTGTNTVVLFLRRKAQRPEPAVQYWNRTLDFFDNWELELKSGGGAYLDIDVVRQYCQHIDIVFDDYQTLLSSTPSVSLLETEMFKDYKTDFDKSTEIMNLKDRFQKQVTDLYKNILAELNKQQKQTKNKNAEIELQMQAKSLLPQKELSLKAEQELELNKRFIKYLQDIEKKKLYYFMLAHANPQKVLIVKSPTDNKEQKQFLGYEWSGSKGSEGIKYNGGDTVYDINTPMFDPTNPQNSFKINYYIQQNFQGIPLSIPDDLQPYISLARLEDLLDFSRKDFNKAISLSVKKDTVIESKWDLVKLGDLAETASGGTPLSSKNEYYNNGSIPWINSGEVGQGEVWEAKNFITETGLKNSSAKIFPKETVLLAMYGATAGKVGILKIEACTNQAVCGILPNNKFLPHYIYLQLFAMYDYLLSLRTGVARDNLSQDKIKAIKIPLPPLSIQQQIVTECNVIDKAAGIAQNEAEKGKREIDEKIKMIYENYKELVRLDKVSKITRGRFSHRPRNEPRFYNGIYPFIQTGEIVKAKGGKISYTQTLNEEGLRVSKLFQPSIVLVTIAANIGDTAVLDYPACFPDSIVALIPTEDINVYFLEFMMREQKQYLNDIAPQMAQKNINIEILSKVKIPVPPIAEQEKLVAEIELLEKRIAESQKIISEAASLKQGVMKKYL